MTSVLTECWLLPSPPGYSEVHLWMVVLTRDVGLSEAHQGPSSSSPGGVSGKEPACQCRRHKRCEFDP